MSGVTLRKLRENAGFTMAEAANQLGISERQLYRLEDGTTRGKRLHWLALSVVYGVAVKKVEAAAAETWRRHQRPGRSSRPARKSGSA